MITIIQNLVVNVPCNVYGICKSIEHCRKSDSLSFDLWDADYSNNVLIKCESEVFREKRIGEDKHYRLLNVSLVKYKGSGGLYKTRIEITNLNQIERMVSVFKVKIFFLFK